jgi:Putative prokaryotic signal transducing protein
MTTADPDEHSDPIAVASYATAGEAEVAKAKLGAYGIEAALDDQIEGGAIVVDGEPGVIVEVKAADADDARRILSEVDAIPTDPPADS